MWTALLSFSADPWEIVFRGTAIYWFLFVMFRGVLRRDTGAVGITDILLIVLIADAAQNAMAGDYKTVPEGMLLVATLVGWNVLADWASFRFPAMRRLLQPPPLMLVRNGQVLHRNLRREFLTMGELMAALRQSGVESPGEVRLACMEADGSISIIKQGARGDAAAGKRSSDVRR